MKKKADATETGLIPANQGIGRVFGESLIEAAQEKNRTALQDAAIAQVQGLQMQLKKQRDYLANCEANIKLLEKKLKAVAAGEIKLSSYGQIVSFTDPALEKAVIGMKECINCGAIPSATSRY